MIHRHGALFLWEVVPVDQRQFGYLDDADGSAPRS